MTSVRTGISPRALLVATLRDSNETSPRPPEPSGNVYLVIALTTLNAKSGILNFFPRDGGELEQTEVLEPGDGIVCCSEDVNPNGGGEGGVILVICYQSKTNPPKD
jgi:hypothetical protein